MTNPITRRDFGQLLGAAAAATASARALDLPAGVAAPLTAGQVIERIKQKLAADGVLWERTLSGDPNAGTVDTIKLGNPSLPVFGIATCFMSTLDVLQRAVRTRKNFIITHEPTFWNHLDDVSAFGQDPVYLAKKRFAEENGLILWRLHDHLHMLRPDPISASFSRQVRWDQYLSGKGMKQAYAIPATTLKAVGLHLQNTLGTRNVRIFGDPDLPVTRIGNAIHGMDTCMRALDGNDAVLVAETREFDTPLYMRDARDLGIKKGLLLIAHERLEEWGMEECARWLVPSIPELPVEFIPSTDPFWIPRRESGA